MCILFDILMVERMNCMHVVNIGDEKKEKIIILDFNIFVLTRTEYEEQITTNQICPKWTAPVRTSYQVLVPTSILH